MKEIKKYVALDGTVWDSKEECAYHEKFDVEQMYEWAMKIKAYCSHNADCQNCPFRKKLMNENGYCLIGKTGCVPNHWEVDDFESDE